MLKAIRYEILRDVEANGRIPIPMKNPPVRVATLLNEEKFKQMDGELRHNDTVFLEDRVHDWHWQDEKFYYYTRVATRADVVVVYELLKS